MHKHETRENQPKAASEKMVSISDRLKLNAHLQDMKSESTF
jgi:hypothetical protein